MHKGWVTCYHKRFTRMKNENKEGDLKKENDPIHGQYTNACKLGANWNGCKIF